LVRAQEIARKVTGALGGAGIWGVEFFLTRDNVVFSELSPRPHDTGLVTLSNCIQLNEFELHVRAVLGLPIPTPELRRVGASAVILADFDSPHPPFYQGIGQALKDPRVDVRIFNKPSVRKYRRMGVAVANAPIGVSTDEVREAASQAAAQVCVHQACEGDGTSMTAT
jgi:phosphoribosylglycinamide formyltransferase 2